MRIEGSIGRWRVWVTTEEVERCEVCDGGFCHFKWEGIGKLCFRHHIDYILDDYTSDFDYTQIDEYALEEGDER